MRSDILAWLSVILCILIFCGPALAVDYSDRALFSAVAPDAMIVLDLSGSMRWNPKGEYDSSQEPLGRFGNDTCSGDTFYDTPRPGFTTDCARYLIAKRAIYQILDDNKDGVIDKKDEAGKGLMRIWKEEGFALVAAILANLILLAVGIIAINISTQDLRLSMKVVGDKKTMSAAEAASHWVILNLNPDNLGSVVRTNRPLDGIIGGLDSRNRITISQPAPPSVGPLFVKLHGYDMAANQWILLRYNTTITARNSDYQTSATLDLGLGYGPVDATSY